MPWRRWRRPSRLSCSARRRCRSGRGGPSSRPRSPRRPRLRRSGWRWPSSGSSGPTWHPRQRPAWSSSRARCSPSATRSSARPSPTTRFPPNVVRLTPPWRWRSAPWTPRRSPGTAPEPAECPMKALQRAWRPPDNAHVIGTRTTLPRAPSSLPRASLPTTSCGPSACSPPPRAHGSQGTPSRRSISLNLRPPRVRRTSFRWTPHTCRGESRPAEAPPSVLATSCWRPPPRASRRDRNARRCCSRMPSYRACAPASPCAPARSAGVR